jgi:putative membrane-bound dehydrogenase-like protein
MSRFALCLILVSISANAQSPQPTSLDGHNFTLPEGFKIERAAGPPLINLPITADFDEQGRLYVAEAGGAITKPEVQAQKPAHRVVRLVDADGDGCFDKSTLFADGVPFPEGTMWLNGSLYVAAPPQIWKFTDTNDDGVADRREVWFDGKTLTGCANDLHGPYRGPDGWIYWCKGAFAKQTYTLPTGATFNTRASHIFRARPDGSAIEPVMTGGMDNPVDTVFTPGGERIFSTTFLIRPAAGLRDGLVHAIYGGVYGKDQDAVFDADHKWTAPDLMPVLVHQGPSAPCGLHRLESDQFGPDYRNNVFSCQFNLRKVSRHVLKPSGATFATEDHDFVVSDNTDFHPTDVLEDADGSLLVLNTGGWYKLCCPSSQLVKDDVLGGIYRIKKVGSHSVRDPRATNIAWNTASPRNLALLLGDERPLYRRRAIEELARRGEVGLSSVQPILNDSKSPAEAATSAVWTACRIDSEAARTAVRAALNHSSETVRHAAAHAVSAWRDKKALPVLVELLAADSRHNRRAAAEALGRIGDPDATGPLLAGLADPANDRTLDHSLTYALIEIGENDALRRAVGSSDPRVRRAALVALDQIGAQLDVQAIIRSLDDEDASIRDSARWIAGRHSEWSDDLLAYFRTKLVSSQTDQEKTHIVELLAKLSKSPAVQNFLAECLATAEKTEPAARVALLAIAASGQKELPPAWTAALANLLTNHSSLTAAALAAIRAVPPAKPQADELATALSRVGESAATPEDRLAALALVPGGLKSVSHAQLDVLLAAIHREQPASIRGTAADVLAKARLTRSQLIQLSERLPTAGLLELDRLLTPFAQSTDDTAGLALLAALSAPELQSAVTVESLKQRLAKYGPPVQHEAHRLYALIDAEHAHQSEHLENTLASLPAGDIRRGQVIFNSTRVSCRNCHTIGFVGGRIGPDLTKIGQIRQPRDLVESILFPSASFVRSYEPILVRTYEGQVLSGNIKKDAPDELILTVAADKDVRIPRADVEELLPGKVSVMPAGLDKQLSLQDLADLVEFLKNCK